MRKVKFGCFIVTIISVLLCGCKSENGRETTVRSTTSFCFSTEGAELVGIYSADDKLQYLSADVLGEMGRSVHEYSFIEGGIIYSKTEILYTEPYYINNGQVKIKETKHSRYMISEEGIYDITHDAEVAQVSEALQETIEADMQVFTEELKQIE